MMFMLDTDICIYTIKQKPCIPITCDPGYTSTDPEYPSCSTSEFIQFINSEPEIHFLYFYVPVTPVKCPQDSLFLN